MNAELVLARGPLTCSIRPDLGGCITGLSFDGVPVLQPANDAPPGARLAGCFALVPFANPAGHASLRWQGTSHPLVQHNAPEPHAIHGIGWQRAWEVLEQDAHFALLAFEHPADSAWPFAFDASQTFRLGPQTLELTLGITNQSGVVAPAGLGWHPNFARRAGCRIAFAATGRWDAGADNLPSHRTPTTGLDADAGSLDIDRCFDGWSGTAHLRDPQLRVRIDSNLSRLVVFTHPSRDTVAIEPVSHVSNAVRLSQAGAPAEDLGLVVLQPGESLSAQMSITVESNA
jgi:aldose 1-epimerase